MLLYFLESDYSINEDYEFKHEDARQFYIRREILRAIASHTCADIYQLDALNFSFLLIVADDSQEWGRKSISELYTQKEISTYKFNEAEIKASKRIDDKIIYECYIGEEYLLSKLDPLKDLIKRFLCQAKTYRDIFRDGQDTANRNFDFKRIIELTVRIDGSDKKYVLELNIPCDKEISVKVMDRRSEFNINNPFYQEIKNAGIHANIDSNDSISICLD